MAEVSAAITAQLALTRQAIALEVIRQSVEMQQQSMAVLMESVASVPVSGARGVNVDISA